MSAAFLAENGSAAQRAVIRGKSDSNCKNVGFICKSVILHKIMKTNLCNLFRNTLLLRRRLVYFP